MTNLEEMSKIVSCAPANEVDTLEDVLGMGRVTKVAEYLMQCGVCVSEPKKIAAAVPKPITRRSVLEDAIKCVCTDRNQQYGEPEDNFAVIAELWSNYTGEAYSAHDVAMMMALFKVGRIMTGVGNADSYVDACGYIACAAEIAMREVSEDVGKD